jgi:hypothetical protein
MKCVSTLYGPNAELFNPFTSEIHLNDIYKFISYFAGNTLCLRYKDISVNDVWKKSRLLSEPYERTKTLYRRTAEFHAVEASGIYI